MSEDKLDYYARLASNPSELREEIRDVVELEEGRTAAYVDLDEKFNLSAIAIGMGLENIEYEPGVFPGLVYRIESPKVTSILFHDDQITAMDASDKNEAIKGIQQTLEMIRMLGLFEGNVPIDEINTSKV